MKAETKTVAREPRGYARVLGWSPKRGESRVGVVSRLDSLVFVFGNPEVKIIANERKLFWNFARSTGGYGLFSAVTTVRRGVKLAHDLEVEVRVNPGTKERAFTKWFLDKQLAFEGGTTRASFQIDLGPISAIRQVA